ncbi:MAG TPA: P-loop NTPase fold protein, partial [Hymenobacter sp.]
EGKTSVMHFIAQELAAHSDAIVINFNPWRFSDEPSLLLAFFTTLAERLKPLSPDTRWYKTRKESIGEAVLKYASYATVLKATPVSGLADAWSGLGKALADVPLEKLKARIEEFLQTAQRKIVVIIDDIDRLEKTEIHAVFRLVRLTADFSFTSYILCFDDRIVASSIGERFADGSQQSGYEFLEKIIHVPLRLPQATKRDLRDYLFTSLAKAIQDVGVSVPAADLEKFRESFGKYFIARFTTPRLAKRYVNSLSFVLPMLQNEVNYHDLLLIEAIKLFYPAIYALIREHYGYFLGSFDVKHWSAQNEQQRHTVFFDQHLSVLSPDMLASIKELLAELFPKLAELWPNRYLRPEYGELFNDKRIASAYYFDRYFSYTILKGEVSDVVYDAFFSALAADKPKAEELWEYLLEAGNLWDLRLRFYSKRNNFTSEQAVGLVAILAGYEAKITAKAQQPDDLFDRPFDTAGQIASLLTFSVAAPHQSAVLEAVFAAPVSFDLLYQTTYELRRSNRRGELVGPELHTQASTGLLARALEEAGTSSLVATHPTAVQLLFIIWAEVRDRASLNEYLHQHLPDEAGLLQLVRAFAPLIYSSSQPVPYLCDFGQPEFLFMRSLLDPEPLAQLLSPAYQNVLPDFPSAGYMEPASDDLLLRQFAYWCQHPPGSAE